MALQWVDGGSNRGPQGAVGPQGPQGVQGALGPQGTQGEVGPQGTQGVQGTQGEAGTGFDPAPSVALVANLPAGDPAGTTRLVLGPGAPSAEGPAGHIFAKEENGTWTDMGQASYVGPQGAAGPQGAQGIQGTQGPQGIQGDDGPTGLTGAQGPQGAAGVQGPQGTAGTNGVRGSKWVAWDGVTPPSLTGILPNDWAQGANGNLLMAVDI